MTLPRQKSPPQTIGSAEAFKVFDENGDGFISSKKLQVVLKKLGLPEGGEMERVEKMIVFVHRNQDGRVVFIHSS